VAGLYKDNLDAVDFGSTREADRHVFLGLRLRRAPSEIADRVGIAAAMLTSSGERTLRTLNTNTRNIMTCNVNVLIESELIVATTSAGRCVTYS
jgi:hypothetical protein